MEEKIKLEIIRARAVSLHNAINKLQDDLDYLRELMVLFANDVNKLDQN